jgi:glycerol-3-phosphate dehydrogenase
MHQCGVRPLPYVDAKTPAAITRRHRLVWNDTSPVPLVSLVGGKLTTCRSLAEETAAAVLAKLGRNVEATSRDRPIPESPVEVALREPRLVADEDEPCLAGTTIPQAIALTCIDDEYATCLEDLVERRLMLHFSPHLSRQTLADLAQILVQTGRLTATDVPSAIARCEHRLQSHFGIQLTSNK